MPTTPALLTAPPTKAQNAVLTRKLYYLAGSDVRLLRSNGNPNTSLQQGLQVLAQQDQVTNLVLDAVGQKAFSSYTGQAPGTHIYCQFVVYSDASHSTITGVSYITDTLVK